MPNLSDFNQFTENAYTRHLVLKTPNMEILVVCWAPGQVTATHGHGPTDGVITVLEGHMQNTNIYPASHASGGKHVSKVHGPGDVCHTPVGCQHRMHNVSDKPAITLHFYAPPLGDEYRNPDLGYANDVETHDIQLSDEAIRIVMACNNTQKALNELAYTI